MSPNTCTRAWIGVVDLLDRAHTTCARKAQISDVWVLAYEVWHSSYTTVNHPRLSHLRTVVCPIPAPRTCVTHPVAAPSQPGSLTSNCVLNRKTMRATHTLLTVFVNVEGKSGRFSLYPVRIC